jgi:MbtH protein
MNNETEDQTHYQVVVNHEEQYSIWPQKKQTPAGWTEVGCEGSKAEVSKYIDENWKDMRPASLRKAMDAAKNK